MVSKVLLEVLDGIFSMNVFKMKNDDKNKNVKNVKNVEGIKT